MKASDLYAQEDKLKRMVAEIKSDVISSVAKEKIKGVTPINSFCFTIRTSNLIQYNWSPDFYSAQAQANLVEQNLKVATTPRKFVEKLADMIETGYVKISNNRYPLNPQTVAVLKKYI